MNLDNMEKIILRALKKVRKNDKRTIKKELGRAGARRSKEKPTWGGLEEMPRSIGGMVSE